MNQLQKQKEAFRMRCSQQNQLTQKSWAFFCPHGPTCSARLQAGLTHLILQLLVLRGDGLPDGDETPHGHIHRLAHPVDGCQGAL